eukprot:GHRQ01007985.1.p1 GENE.GHRQ01007985.1~~GHRQ01007985.1.p1  ORF type:complete len:390 (+),score=73.58 GHRQ01007985.1:224-1393(+)
MACKGCAVALWLVALSHAWPATSDCRLGLLKPPSGAGWAITAREEVYSIVPQFVSPGDETTESQRPVRPAESAIYAETRPALQPSNRTRLCLRSLAPVAAACAAGKTAPAADAPQATDPASVLFDPAYGFPSGPCMELSADGSSASLIVFRPRPASCFPGAGYCSDLTNTWQLFVSKNTDGKQQLKLRIVRERSTYQDTDSSRTTWTAELPLTLTAGCALKVSADAVAAAAAADPAAVRCIACSGKAIALASAASSSNCLRCPSRSSKAREALTPLGAAAASWKCIPGMPKLFETVPVRMGLGGHPECASTNGKICLRGLPGASSCQAMLPQLTGEKVATLQPLVCGAAHAKKWPGNTGYNTAGHWCNVAREWFQDLQPTVLGKCVVKP